MSDIQRHWIPSGIKLCPYIADTFCNKCGWVKPDSERVEREADTSLNGVSPVDEQVKASAPSLVAGEVLSENRKVQPDCSDDSVSGGGLERTPEPPAMPAPSLTPECGTCADTGWNCSGHQPCTGCPASVRCDCRNKRLIDLLRIDCEHQQDFKCAVCAEQRRVAADALDAARIQLETDENVVRAQSAKMVNLQQKFDAAREQVEQLQIQLAGCLTAAEGHVPDPPIVQGDYGWSLAYQTTMDLREQVRVLEEEVKTNKTWHGFREIQRQENEWLNQQLQAERARSEEQASYISDVASEPCVVYWSGVQDGPNCGECLSCRARHLQARLTQPTTPDTEGA